MNSKTGKNSFANNPLLWLIIFLLVRQGISILFHGSAFYADEFKDYFTTMHGLVYGHQLGEWYTATNMRSYAMLFPILPLFRIFKGIGLNNIYLQETIIKVVIGFYSILGLIFSYKIMERLGDRKRAILVGIIYILHPFIIYTNQSILTEQAAAIIFLLNIYLLLIFTDSQKNKRGLSLFTLYTIFWLGAGFSVMARLDSVFFMAPLGIYYMYKEHKTIDWKLWLGSLILAFVALGMAESIYTGVFYGPQINRLLFEGVKRKGNIGAISPRIRTIEDLGGNLLYPILVMGGYYFFKTIKEKKIGIFHFPILFFVLFHFWMPHKEIRYLYPITMVVITFLFIHIPNDYISFNFRKKGVTTFWGLTIINALVLLFIFIPWGGKPRLSQDISRTNFYLKELPVLISNNRFEEFDSNPMKGDIEFNYAEPEITHPTGRFILFIEQSHLSEWEGFIEKNNCTDFDIPGKDGQEKFMDHPFLPYACHN